MVYGCTWLGVTAALFQQNIEISLKKCLHKATLTRNIPVEHRNTKQTTWRDSQRVPQIINTRENWIKSPKPRKKRRKLHTPI